MSNNAMKAARADVQGHEIRTPRRRRHGQGERNLSGHRAMFTRQHGRLAYTGATRNRSRKVAKGHPLAGLWRSWGGMTRSHRPDVRAYVARRDRKAVQTAWVDEMPGTGL